MRLNLKKKKYQKQTNRKCQEKKKRKISEN